MKSHYKKLVKFADKGVENVLKSQCRDSMSREYGGFIEMRKGFTEHSRGPGSAGNLIVLYYNEDSAYHMDKRLLDSANLAMDYTLRIQNDDGTIDLVETNFHCAATMGFTLQNFIQAYRVIKKFSNHTASEDELQEKFLTYIKNGARGMMDGGFHTPNHRWVVASALSLCYNELGDKSYLDEIDLYLNEGIDCNEDGEWTERSAGIYNKVNNDGMIIMAEELGKWELLEAAQRNLYMMFTYLEPDDSLFTLNSHRQDIGKVMYPMKYYENYLMAAHYLKNKHFAYMADYLFNMSNDYAKDYGPLSTATLLKPIARYMLLDFLRNNELEKEPYDWEHFEEFYKESNIVRKRCGDVITTVMGEGDMFCKFQKGRNQMVLRYAGSYYGVKGRFSPDSLTEIDGGYRLHFKSEWGYVRPLGKPDRPTKDGHTNIEHRERANMSKFEVNIDILPSDDGMQLVIDSMGCENLPVKLEMIFQPDGFFDCEQTEFKASAGQHIMVRYGKYRYIKGQDVIEVDGAFGETNYHSDLRGSHPEVPGAFTVYFTAWSPTKRTINIKGI